MMKRRRQMPIRGIVAVGIGAALFFVLGRFVHIPTPIPNTSINIQYAILAVFGVIYGPAVSFLAGFIGHTLIDLSFGSPWWSWIIASAIFGLIVGFGKYFIATDKFGLVEQFKFNGIQLIAHGVAWGIVAPAFDILIYNEPARKVLIQGVFAGVSNVISTGIVGCILLASYAKTKTTPGSLRKEFD